MLNYKSILQQSQNLLAMQHKGKKKIAVVERILFNPVPETPVPEPYFNIPSPEPYRFPLSETMLEGVKFLEHFTPEDVNQLIQFKIPSRRIERMIKYRDNTCMLGINGNGLLINETFMDVKGVTAFAYGPTHLIIAFADLRLEVYTLQLKLIKAFKGFSQKKISFLKILSVPKSFESIVILTYEGRKVFVHRLQKSMFSTLSVKLSKQVIGNLEYPVTQMTEIPSFFKFYFKKDADYKDCSLVCVSAVNIVYILKVNHFRLSLDDFISIDHIRKHPDVTVNSVSWGEARIQAPSRFIAGDKLILTYTFGSEVYFLALRDIEKYINGEIMTKYEWVESYPLKVDEGIVVFCQFIKKNEIFMITEDNTVIIFHTKQLDIFEKQFRTKGLEKFTQKSPEQLQARVVSVVMAKRQTEVSMESRDESGLADYEKELVNQAPLVTYADTFEYEYPSNEVYFLTQKKFELYHYCDWRVITKMMRVQQKFECAMLFFIAIHKKVNKFELGVEGCEAEISEAIQMLSIEYINKKLGMLKSMPNINKIIEYLNQEDEYFKMIVTPIEFLVETEEFAFLFEIAKDKIISALTVSDTESSHKNAEHLFYEALSKFVEHGRIKFIPDEQLKITLKYFADHDNLGMIDRLAIFFDLNKIDRNIVIQCLLKNNLVVSLAHVCTQGNESQFVTPFVKLWGISQNFKRQKNNQYAAMFAIKALWYLQLCLQRNWALKEYSFEKYAEMIRVLSTHFLTEKIITGLLQIKTEYCLQTLAFYFTIENSQIICQTPKSYLKFTNVKAAKWIKPKEGCEQLELLLSAIQQYLNLALSSQNKAAVYYNLFLSTIIIYKTVKFTEQKYFDILISLIENYTTIKTMKYGLEEKVLDHFKEQFEEESAESLDKILASQYINKILTLVYYECNQFIKSKFPTLLSKAAQHNLTDFQAEINFLLGRFKECIQIYKKSVGRTQNLVFKFLQNSFKRLILEKRKQDKRKMANCITQNIEWMVEMDPQSTINIIQNFIQQIQDTLIEALSGKEALQLQFLEGIINNENLVQMKEKLSDQSIARYVELMAIKKKEQLIDSFKKNPRFTTEETLKICEKYRVYDCMEYLYERMGNIAASVKIAALRVDELLEQRSNYVEDDEDTAPYIKIKEILDNVIEVCKKNHSEQIWESLLDSFIDLYTKYEKSNLPEGQIEVFEFINGLIMENLASNCPIEHTVDLLKNKYKNLNMGGTMSKAFVNIMANLSHSINILYIATNLISASLQHELMQDYESKLHCYSTSSFCQACKYGIVKRNKSVHFRCGHAYHTQCLVSKDPLVCVFCLQRQTEQFDYYLNTLNPQHPKIKKVSELFQKFEQNKLIMSETFKVEEQERSERKEDNINLEIGQKKKNKFSLFDQSLNELETGNRRVLKGLAL